MAMKSHSCIPEMEVDLVQYTMIRVDNSCALSLSCFRHSSSFLLIFSQVYHFYSPCLIHLFLSPSSPFLLQFIHLFLLCFGLNNSAESRVSSFQAHALMFDPKHVMVMHPPLNSSTWRFAKCFCSGMASGQASGSK